MVTTSPPLPELAARLRLAVVRTARRLRQDAYEGEDDGALSPTLTAALATISNHGPLTPSELAERERVRRPTATRVVSRLSELGLVTRTPDPSDGRGCLVAITGEGTALIKRMRGRKNAYLAKRMRNLGPDEVATLERAAEILERMLDEDPGRRTL
jgi:DNA-binding MarR family transcriptional regulator